MGALRFMELRAVRFMELRAVRFMELRAVRLCGLRVYGKLIMESSALETSNQAVSTRPYVLYTIYCTV